MRAKRLFFLPASAAVDAFHAGLLAGTPSFFADFLMGDTAGGMTENRRSSPRRGFSCPVAGPCLARVMVGSRFLGGLGGTLNAPTWLAGGGGGGANLEPS